MRTLRPLHDRILVRRLDAATRTETGLFIPEAAKEKPQEAEIIAVGTGRILASGEVAPLKVELGQRVLFGKFAGDEIEFDGDKFIVLREEDILAVVGP